MSYCRQGHTLQDNEAENFRHMVPGVEFEIEIAAVTYFGVVDEYATINETEFSCRLYTDPARTILHETALPIGIAYEITGFVGWGWEPKDLKGNDNTAIGTFVTNPIDIRDDIGVWTGRWIGSPRLDETIEYNFDGTHARFKAPVSIPQIAELPGAGVAAGDHVYCIVPVDGSGRLGAGSRSLPITLAGAANVQLAWQPNNQAASFNIYGRTAGTVGLMANVAGNAYVDDGTDAPNPAFKPPLFEDPAWTQVAANFVEDGTEGATSFVLTGDFDPDIETFEENITVSKFTGVGIQQFDDGVTGDFALTDFVSTTTTKEDVVATTMFVGQTPIVGDVVELEFTEIVYINDAGNKVVFTNDVVANQTIEVEFDAVANTYTVTLINEDGIFVEVQDALPADVLPAVGGATIKQVFTVTGFDGDTGAPLVTEVTTSNTYQATPLPVPVGELFLISHFETDKQFQRTASPADLHIRKSTDQLVSFAEDFALADAPSFALEAGNGETSVHSRWVAVHADWMVVAGSDGDTPSMVALHWAPLSDLVNGWTNATAWTGDAIRAKEFLNDAALFSQNPTVRPERNEMNRMNSTSLGGNVSSNDIQRGDGLVGVTCANGLILFYNPFSDEVAAGTDRASITAFDPVSGTVSQTFFSTGRHRSVIIWPEENLLFSAGDNDGPDIGKLYRHDIVNVPAAPFINETLVTTLANSFFRLWSVGPDRVFARSIRNGPFNEVYVDHSTDGITFNRLIDVRAGSDPDAIAVPRYNPNIAHAMFPHPDLGYIYNGGDFTASTPPRIYQSVDGLVWSFLSRALGFYYDKVGGINDYPSNFCGSPYDGVLRYTPGPDSFPNDQDSTFLTVRAEDSSLVDQGLIVLPAPPVPSQAGDTQWDRRRCKFIAHFPTVGGARSQDDLQNVNLGSSVAQPINIPVAVGSPPPPLQISVPAKTPIYTTNATERYRNAFSTVNDLLEVAKRGGADNDEFLQFAIAHEWAKAAALREELAPFVRGESMAIGVTGSFFTDITDTLPPP